MRSRLTFWILFCLLLLAGAWFFWPQGSGRDGALRRPQNTVAPAAQPHLAPSFTTTRSASTAPQFLTGKNSTNAISSATKTNQFPYRLANTKKSIGELTGDRHAILLENALIDTGAKLDLNIPKNLQSQGDPGAYIVQARGPIDAAFRAQLAAAGAQIVSYIPNDAYLVRVPSGGANELAALPLAQSVIPYEPYYKISSTLIGQAVEYPDAQPSAPLTLGLFANDADATIAAIKKLGGQIIATGSSPFGPTVRVLPPKNWTALAVLPGVQIVEPLHQRIHANDLSRATVGVSADSVTTANYLNLGGSNVMVAVDDSGIDHLHPDFTAGGTGPVRIFADDPANLMDTDGHGTFVAGQIAGDGTESITVTNVQGSIITNMPGPTASPFQFRGKAPLATLFSMNFEDSDQQLQAAAALTNALISNNSWNFVGDTTYDLAAASYDAATRDALPLVTGSQPVLFVFSAGNIGNGDDTADPGGGNPDTILSPATAKNVITVGAIQQLRNITNLVTEPDGTTNAIWAAETSTPDRVAGFSSRGNVGIGIEGPTGRDKPDVVAPGTFVVSTRSEQWDINSYFFQSPTNHDVQEFDHVIAQPNSVFASSFPFVPDNAVQATIQVLPNADSPVPFPFLPIFVGLESAPGYTFFTTNNQVSIPPDGGLTIADILSSELFVGFNFGVSNITTEPISFDLITDIVTTNNIGNELLVLSNLDQSIGAINPSSTGPGPYYRYESGTSMAAADVSGVLALMQGFFTNTLHVTPSPALMKAMLINGARPTLFYNFGSQNPINFEGWGSVNLPNSLPLSVTNLVTNPTGGTNTSIFFLDQSPTNALATGDSQTFTVTVNTNNSTTLPLRVTLAWTDPPGNPAAAIKLVNNLDLVVTNLVTGDVFFGNDIPADSVFNSPWNTNGSPNLDTINNIENVFLSPPLSGSYSITVVGRDVNVNAVTAQTNNVVQDYALVITCGDSADGGAITVTPATPAFASNPTGDQQITFVNVNANGMATNSSSTGGVFLNQLAGANTPLLGTNTVEAVSNYTGNAVVTLGMTNQWHFYVVQNTTGFTNAAFITFLPDTLATPRMGVFADSDANSTQPEADIDLYVSTSQSLTNLDPMVISNCVNGTQVGVSAAGTFNGASLSRGGTEFVADTGSQPNQVYYVGVKSETAEAAEYGFFSVFSQQPFSQMVNGNEVVNGLLLPMPIPDGTPAHPGKAYIFALAVQPIEAQDVIVNNQTVHQNFGDLIGTLTHNGTPVVLNNHDSLGNPPGPYNFIYDDGPSPSAGSQPSDGPGSLQDFQGQQGIGPWILTEVDDSLTQTGAVTGFSLVITPHQDLGLGISGSLPPGGITNFFIDVPVGVTNLSISATNTTIPPDTGNPLQLFEKFGVLPTPQQPPPPTNFDKMVLLTNFPPAPPGLFPGNSISVGQSDTPPIQPGRYFVTLFNPGTTTQTFFIIAAFEVGQVAPVNFSSGGPVPLLDDAVTYSFITNNFTAGDTNETIAAINVGIRVDHPRISDLVFHLISPDGTRFLLMENRGGTSTNGAGVTIFSTNDIANISNTGTTNSVTNSFPVSASSGTLPISWNFFTIPDQLTVYDTTNNFTPGNLIFDTGMTNGTGQVNLPYTTAVGALTIIINQFGNPNPNGDEWTYTAGGVSTNFVYLTFTEDTNLTTIPIKFAPPPFVPGGSAASGNQVANGNFETPVVPTSGPNPGLIGPITTGLTGWTVDFGNIDILGLKSPGNPYWQPAAGNQSIDLNGQIAGAIYQDIPTVVGQVYNLRFAHACNPDNKTNHTLSVFWAGVNVTNVLFTNANTTVTSMGWQYVTLSVIGSGGLDRLEFKDLNGETDGAGPTLDDVSLTPVIVPNNLYYLPEESLDPLIGTSAYGLWQLEIQDDRVGATNNVVLDSWQLQFVFADTNPAAAILPPGTETCGTAPASGILWYQVNVPPNAIVATNTLFSADSPVNLLFNPNGPDTNGAIVLLANKTSGSTNLSITSTPPLIPGSAYFLGVQNPNGVPVNNCIEVDFDLTAASPPFAFTEPAQAVTGTSAQLNGMATPNGLPATAWFQWGTTTNYGNQTPLVSVGNSFNVVYVTNSISLTPNVPYHFRLVVSNAFTVVKGFDQILDEANVVVWGANFAGQKFVPAGLSNVVAIAGAYDHSLALKNDETAVVWGDNTFNQTNVPAALNNNLVAVAGGESYSLALKNSGTVIAWGANIFPGETNVPAGLNSVVTIASGQYSSMALQNNGAVVAWGANISGLTNVPAAVNNAVAIAGGSFHNLALINNGTVVAWGDDSIGQTNVPADLTNVVAISAGSFHSLALKNDGTVTAWGDDTAGQTNVPVGLSNVVAIAAGGFHSLALKNDGTVTAWGDSSAGQTSVPAGLSNVVAIAGGNLHSLALTPLFNINSTNPIVLSLTNGAPQTGSILPGGITFYQINVPVNANFATNLLLSADGPLNAWFTTNTPPSIVINATLLFAGVTNGAAVLSTTSVPTNIVPGTTYYLGVQNTNAITVNYAVEVDFHLLIAPPVVISGIIHTNGGFLLTWFAPSNDLFQVQWNDNLGSTNWTTFTNPPAISYNTNFSATASSATFTFFDDGSQTPPGLPPIRFYRLILLQSTNLTSTNAIVISHVLMMTNGLDLTWSAPTNDQFQVQWTTNLAPPVVWTLFPGTNTSITGTFTFLDTNAPMLMKFYQLILLP